MKKIYRIVFIVLAAFSFIVDASAMDLNTARQSGLVGENLNGYLEIVDTSSGPEVRALVSEINSKRQAEYTEISKKNGQAMDVVEKLAASKIIAKLPSGQFYKNESGAWVKK